ncbi:MAG: hypothetical protein IKI20_07140 [Lachnospiraceae bacterium]|nr:hypothetical protein [Lachnospiraceae bacterium]
MKSNLSQKDKRLLLFMFLFVVVVGIGYWGIYPQIKAYNKLEAEIAEQEALQSINQQKVANYIFVETQCEEFEQSMAEDKQKFFDRMNEADVDKLLTTKALKHGLESFNLNIVIESTPSTRKAYKYSELYQQQLQWEAANKQKAQASSSTDELIEDLEKDTGKKNSDKEEDEEDGKVTQELIDIFGDTDTVGLNNDIYAARVSMTLGGSKEELQAFLEEMMNFDKEVLITSFAWSEYRVQRLKEGIVVTEENKKDIKRTDYEIVTMDALTINMELYMCDKD